jgi:hypothetical protein
VQLVLKVKVCAKESQLASIVRGSWPLTTYVPIAQGVPSIPFSLKMIDATEKE